MYACVSVEQVSKIIILSKIGSVYEPELFADLFFIDGRRGEKYNANMIGEALASIMICVKHCTTNITSKIKTKIILFDVED